MLGPYQDFALSQSLMSSIYPTSPQLDEGEEGYSNYNSAMQALKRTITERGQYKYSFREYQCTWILMKCCCCFISKDRRSWKEREWRYNRYEDALERMNGEIDVLKSVSGQRMTQFLAKILLKKHQRTLVQSFSKYQIDVTTEDDAREQFENGLYDAMTMINDPETNTEEMELSALADLTQPQRNLLKDIAENFDPY